MRVLPAGAAAYRRTPEFSEETCPAALRGRHATKAGVWGRIEVVEGALLYTILEPDREEHALCPGRPGIVEPEVPHFVTPQGAVRFFVEFLREGEPADA